MKIITKRLINQISWYQCNVLNQIYELIFLPIMNLATKNETPSPVCQRLFEFNVIITE
jgi:hypothetical protein